MNSNTEYKLKKIQAIFATMSTEERRLAIQELTRLSDNAECDAPGSEFQEVETPPQTTAKYQIMNHALEMISEETNFDTAINKLLAIIAQESGADRCYVFRFTDNGEYCDNTHEWVIRPEIAEKDNLQHVPTASWYKYIACKTPLVINNTDHPPKEYDGFIDFLRIQHIKSIFLIGLRIDGKLCGFLGVDFVDRYNTFSAGMRQILKHAAKLYDIACERARNLQLIEEKKREIKNREELLNTIINSLPVNVFAKDAACGFRYVMVNRHFADFIGKPVEEIIGKTDHDLFVHTEDWTWIERHDKEIMVGGKSQSATETVFDAKGQKFQLQTIKTPCVGPVGKKLLLGVSVDISRNANISKSREIIRQCLETLVLNPNLEDGINRSISQVRDYINADRIYFFKFDFATQTGGFFKEFFAPHCQPIAEAKDGIPLSTLLDWNHYFHDECFLNFPDLQNEKSLKQFGPYYEKLIKEYNARSLYCHRILIQGKLWGYIGIIFEQNIRILTEDELEFVQSTARFVEIMIQHEQMQSELLRALKEAKASEKAKSYFLATMSHEIRTPLNAVIGFSEILKDGTLPQETQKSYLNNISVAGNALLELINDVLDLSKLEAGQMVFSPAETDFSALVNEVATIFQQRLRDKKIDNTIHIDPMPTLLLDKLRMRQILFNLMGNAVKFTEHGYIKFTATFTPVGATSGTLQFALSDTGCGIPAEEQERLFQPFVQSNAIRGTQAERNGTGLGLAIIRRMLERLHGDIHLESEPGKGSTFTVTMRNVAYVVKRHIKSLAAPTDSASADNFSGRILVVDDVVMNLKVMQAMLNKLKIDSEIASSPAAALKCLEEKDFSLILCDLWMPGMNGDELAAKIRKLYSDHNMKIIALTADTEASVSFKMNVFDGVLRKPISMDALKQVLAACCRK